MIPSILSVARLPSEMNTSTLVNDAVKEADSDAVKGNIDGAISTVRPILLPHIFLLYTSESTRCYQAVGT